MCILISSCVYRYANGRDCGTEKSNLAFIQPYLRQNHHDCFSGTTILDMEINQKNQVQGQ